jgi:BMFP domain-containing protein YqiC
MAGESRQDPRFFRLRCHDLKGDTNVVDPKIIDDLAKKVASSMPESLRALQSDVEQNFKSTLQAGLGKLDLVTREEFDVQTSVLRRTREKLKKLEERLAALESPVAASDD